VSTAAQRPGPAAAEPAGEASKPARQRKGTVSLPGRTAAAAIVDAPSLVDDLRAQPTPMVPSSATPGPTPAVPIAAPARAPSATPPRTPAVAPAAPPPPPKKQAPPRVQFSTKLPPALITDIKDFSDHYKAEIQIVVELALQEYLTSRGWTITS